MLNNLFHRIAWYLIQCRGQINSRLKVTTTLETIFTPTFHRLWLLCQRSFCPFKSFSFETISNKRQIEISKMQILLRPQKQIQCLDLTGQLIAIGIFLCYMFHWWEDIQCICNEIFKISHCSLSYRILMQYNFLKLFNIYKYLSVQRCSVVGEILLWYRLYTKRTSTISFTRFRFFFVYLIKISIVHHWHICSFSGFFCWILKKWRKH